MKKKIALIMLGLVIIAGLLVWDIWQGSDTAPSSTEDYVTGIDGKVTRAEVAKMISLLHYTKEELQALERVIPYTDTTKEKWYDKYINGFYTMNLVIEEIKEGNNEFVPMKYITYGDMENIVKQLLKKQKGEKKAKKAVLKKVTAFNENHSVRDFVAHEDWYTLYHLIYETVFKKSNIVENDLYTFYSWEEKKDFEKWKVITSHGVFYGEGVNLSVFVDRKCKVLCKGDEIIGIESELDENIELPNVYIMGQRQDSLTVFVNGYKRKFETKSEIKKKIKRQVADITVKNGSVLKVSVKPDKIKGRVLKTGKDFIEIEGYGQKKISGDFRIYKINEETKELELESANSILVGYENAEFVIVKNKLCAGIIKGDIDVKTIRVLLKTDGFKDVIHSSATVTATSKFTVTYGTKEKTYKADKKITIKPDSKLLKNGRITIKPLSKDGKIKVLSIKRNEETPAYRGILEIDKEKDGILLVNELPMEQYLYAVIPSEMPTAYGVEAQKVQAVCARSYAYKQLFANGCREYGAHVDDSPSYQVYNNVPENKVSIEAVKKTYGQVLKYQENIITAYYFSTSCGHTTNVNDVWSSATPVPYLIGSFQGKKQDVELDLSNEEDFKTFITQKKYNAYEKKNPWYRWSTMLTKKQIKQVMDMMLEKRYYANPNLILTLQEDGIYKSVPIRTIGDVKDIQIAQRKTGGIITELIIVGSEHTIKVLTEYNIRLLLAPVFGKVVRQDNSKLEQVSMLPSAFFSMEEQKKGKKVVGYKLYGGGYGHGVGMSQNGAKAMIDLGKDYEDILKHFYKGAELSVIS